MTEASGPTERYCIVGAGASGLLAARALLRVGVEVEIFERHDAVGGIWNITHPGSPVYESCNFISDREHSGFIGYRMDSTLAEYPTWRDVRTYIREFAARFALERRVVLNTAVVRAEPFDECGRTVWRVTLSSGEVRTFRGVDWACGQQQSPVMPAYEGLSSFEGRLLHSSAYKSGTEFTGKRVLVVGAGNSGVDIACDAAVFGDSAFLSLRRGYWFSPKRLFGQPKAAFLDRTAVMPPGFPDLNDMTLDEINKMILSTVGDLRSYGLPQPEHELGSTHPIANDQVLYQIAHGRLSPKPDISHVSGQKVVFVDGSSEEIDVLVCATGFSVDVPWLDSSLLDWHKGEPDFHLGTFARRVPGLYAVGLLHFPGHTFATWDRMAQLIVADVLAELRGENVENVAQLRNGYDPDLRKDVALLDVPRNTRQVSMAGLQDLFNDMRNTFHIPVPERVDELFYADYLAACDAAARDSQERMGSLAVDGCVVRASAPMPLLPEESVEASRP